MAQTKEGRRMWAFMRNKAIIAGAVGLLMGFSMVPEPPPPEEPPPEPEPEF